MVQIVKQNKGFTLIEALVSIFLLAVVFLGLLTGLILTYNISTKNEIRNQAIKLTQELLEDYRSTDFDSITDTNISCTDNSATTITRKVKNSTITYQIGKKIVTHTDTTGNGLDVKEIQIETCWDYKGKQYKVTMNTLIKREP